MVKWPARAPQIAAAKRPRSRSRSLRQGHGEASPRNRETRAERSRPTTTDQKEKAAEEPVWEAMEEGAQDRYLRTVEGSARASSCEIGKITAQASVSTGIHSPSMPFGDLSKSCVQTSLLCDILPPSMAFGYLRGKQAHACAGLGSDGSNGNSSSSNTARQWNSAQCLAASASAAVAAAPAAPFTTKTATLALDSREGPQPRRTATAATETWVQSCCERLRDMAPGMLREVMSALEKVDIPAATLVQTRIGPALMERCQFLQDAALRRRGEALCRQWRQAWRTCTSATRTRARDVIEKGLESQPVLAEELWTAMIALHSSPEWAADLCSVPETSVFVQRCQGLMKFLRSSPELDYQFRNAGLPVESLISRFNLAVPLQGLSKQAETHGRRQDVTALNSQNFAHKAEDDPAWDAMEDRSSNLHAACTQMENGGKKGETAESPQRKAEPGKPLQQSRLYETVTKTGRSSGTYRQVPMPQNHPIPTPVRCWRRKSAKGSKSDAQEPHSHPSSLNAACAAASKSEQVSDAMAQQSAHSCAGTEVPGGARTPKKPGVLVKLLSCKRRLEELASSAALNPARHLESLSCVFDDLERLDVDAEMLRGSQTARVLHDCCCHGKVDSYIRARTTSLRRRWREVWASARSLRQGKAPLEAKPKLVSHLGQAAPSGTMKWRTTSRAKAKSEATQHTVPAASWSIFSGDGEIANAAAQPRAQSVGVGRQEAEARAEIARILAVDEDSTSAKDFAVEVLQLQSGHLDVCEAARAFRRIARRIHPDGRQSFSADEELRCHEAMARIQRARAAVERHTAVSARNTRAAALPLPTPKAVRCNLLPLSQPGSRRWKIEWETASGEKGRIAHFEIRARDGRSSRFVTVAAVEPQFDASLGRFVEAEELRDCLLLEQELRPQLVAGARIDGGRLQLRVVAVGKTELQGGTASSDVFTIHVGPQWTQH